MKPELKIVVSNEPVPPVPPEPPPQQVEMPFAVVNGEPITELPKDLYIPPQALEVFLEAFEGPLDLLLYLIRRQNLDVLDIPIAEITRQYMKYIDVMAELQLELAGEYMVMAATLAEIKSRMLLPRAHVETSEEDPRAELVRRLQEYERFKAAAENIDGLSRLERDVWSASAELKDRKVVRLVPQVTLQEMLLAFKEVVVRSEMFAHHHIQRERLSIRQRMSDIVSSLETASFVEFIRLFRPEEGRMGVTVTFVAILELVREGLIEIVQAEPFAPLHVRPAGAHRGLRLVKSTEEGEETIAAEDIDLNADDVAHANEEAKLVDPTFVDDTDFEIDDGPLVGIDDVPLTASAQTDEVVASAEEVVAQAEELASVETEHAAELTTLPADDELASVEADAYASPALAGEEPVASASAIVTAEAASSDESLQPLEGAANSELAEASEVGEEAVSATASADDAVVAGEDAPGTLEQAALDEGAERTEEALASSEGETHADETLPVTGEANTEEPSPESGDPKKNADEVSS